ncbi:hypothetical protein D8B23_20235, partial [Verminephrobacter aporrectodeae subsp. tuberculatae]|uniref:Ig-like domain-containing protein n=1 Tax=Verminephrobacter aporrectodeae TaxID=1110389 RepID=UPI002243EAE2
MAVEPESPPVAGQPTATITLSDTRFKSGETAIVTFRFNSSVTDFTLDDVDLKDANGTLSELTADADGKTWRATFTPQDKNTSNTNTIRLNLSGVTNAAGIPGVGSVSSPTYSLDTAPPTIERIWCAYDDDKLSAGESVPLIIRCSEALDRSSFTLADLHVPEGKGTLSNLRTDDGIRWTCILTAPMTTPASGESPEFISIPVYLGGITDLSGNAGEEKWAQNNVYTLDTIRPTATITLDDYDLTVGETTILTLTCSERTNWIDWPTAFDLTNANGTCNDRFNDPGSLRVNLTPDDKHMVWKVTFTPTANVNDVTNTIRVNLRGISDVAGNTGMGSIISANYRVNTTVQRPTATVVLADTRLSIGETSIVTFTFREPVSGFDAADINLAEANGTLGALTGGADGKTWSATFTPKNNIEDASNTLRVNLAGVTNAAGTAGLGEAVSSNYQIDTLRPTVTITLADTNLTIGETTTVTFAFSETVGPLVAFDDLRDTVDLRDAHGKLGPLTSPDGKTFTGNLFWLTADLENATSTIRINLSGVKDRAGNTGVGVASSANYIVNTRSTDTTPPSATITLTDSNIRKATVITITFTEEIRGVNESDFDLTDANGTLDFLSSFDHIVWTTTFTPTENVRDTTNTIRMNLGRVQDMTGNYGQGSVTSGNYLLDTLDTTVRPTITLDDSSLTVGETTTVTFRFSETVTGFTADNMDLRDANGTLGPLTASPDGKTWSATFTPASSTHDASNRIGANLTGVRNAAGQTGPGKASSDNYQIDTQLPSVIVTLADTLLTLDETTTVSFSFNEIVTGFSRDNINLEDAHGTLGPLLAGADGRTWSASFTPTVGMEDGSNHIRVNLAGVSNAAGNTGTGYATSDNYQIDTQRPSVIVTLDDTSLTAGETTSVTFAFSEQVNSPPVNAIDLANAHGTLDALTANADGTTWSATFTPTANAKHASNHISVNLTNVTDAAGNAGTGTATSIDYLVDTTVQRPSATITLDDTSLTIGKTTTVTFRFSEVVTGFTADDILLTDASGTLGPLAADTEGKTWSATFTPAPDREDPSNRISVNLAGVANAAGHTGLGRADSANYIVDTTARPTITLADTVLTVGETTIVTFRFNTAVTDFTGEDIVLTNANGTLGELTADAEGKTWSATFTPTPNKESASNRISVDLAGVRNAAGHTGTGSVSSADYLLDTMRPQVTGVMPGRGSGSIFSAGETDSLNISFSEKLNPDSFTLDDLSVPAGKGTLSNLYTHDGIRWWCTLTAPTTTPASGDSPDGVPLLVSFDGITDVAGNPILAPERFDNIYTIDTTPPRAVITLADTYLTAGETTTLTITFSEDVLYWTDGIVLSDANGTCEPIEATADRKKIWTTTFTPTANVNDASNTISLDLSYVSDPAGNAGVGRVTSANYHLDTTTLRPSATITLADTLLTEGERTTVSFRFTEPVTGFTIDDIDLTHASGTLDAFTAGPDGKTWSATFTPPADKEVASNRISVDLSRVTTAAGLAGIGTADSANYQVDTVTVRPTVTITLADTRLTAGETTTVTFNFSEPVNGFTIDDIDTTKAKGILGPLAAGADGKTWSAPFTPKVDPQNNEDRGTFIRVNLTGVTNAAGHAGIGSVTNSAYRVDILRPSATIVLADTHLTAGETSLVSFEFSEYVLGLALEDIVLTDANGTLSAITNLSDTHGELPNLVSSKNWSATFTPTANVSDATNTIRLNLSGVIDELGNTGMGQASSANYTVDTRPINTPTRPIATITLDDTDLTAGETTRVTFRFSEIVTGFTAADVDLTDANGIVGPLTVGADGTTWTTLFTPKANTEDATNTISMNLNGVRNAAGNAGVVSVSSANYRLDTRSTTTDTTGPTTATIALANSALKAGQTTTVTITFTEPVSGLDVSDFVVPNGSLSAPTANADRTVWTSTFTPTLNANDATNTIELKLTGVTDDIPNPGVGS